MHEMRLGEVAQVAGDALAVAPGGRQRADRAAGTGRADLERGFELLGGHAYHLEEIDLAGAHLLGERCRPAAERARHGATH